LPKKSSLVLTTAPLSEPFRFGHPSANLGSPQWAEYRDTDTTTCL
jgi:hypothetical protein